MIWRNPAWGFLLLLAGGCTMFPERPPRPALHDFGPNRQDSGTATAITVDAPEWLQDDRIRYRLLYDDDTQVRYYTLDRWVAPPALLLAQRLGGLTERRLRPHVQLLEFEQIFERPGQAYVVLVLRVTVTVPGEATPVSEVFTLRRTTRTPDAAGAVAAFAVVADQGARRVRDWLSAFGNRGG